jgi:hypothetical protein
MQLMMNRMRLCGIFGVRGWAKITWLALEPPLTSDLGFSLKETQLQKLKCF